MPNHRSIEDCFNKSFTFTGNQSWSLPTEAFESPPWQVDSLQQMKSQLNKVKSQLSSFNLEKWSKHTRFRDPSSSIISTLKTKANIELLTQAWCKFYECLSRYPSIIPETAACRQELTSLHLCEAPGAFVSALNRFLYTHHRKFEWYWVANTLNPYYEGNPASDMIADDRLIRHTLGNWNFGADLTGDLMKYYNYEALVQGGPVMLVTADGSVDCMNDPGEQENHVHFLHYCEIMTALRVLEKWGSFVVKLFTMFEHGTICLMYLLTCSFTKVHVFKPCSSKSGNSEVYVICLGYKGWDSIEPLWPLLIAPYQGHRRNMAMFSLKDVNLEFLIQLEACAQFFMQLQSTTINDNVKHYTGEEENNEEEINRLKLNVADYFMKRCRLAFHIPKRLKLMNYDRRQKFSENDWDVTEFNLENFPKCFEKVDVKIGRAIETVTASIFCQVTLQSKSRVNENALQATICPFITPNSLTINHEQFCNFPQYEYEREVFYKVASGIKNKSDVVLVGIPLLTRFLVGLVYVLAQSFESVLIYKKGLLLFQNAIGENDAFKTIEQAYYVADYEEKFLADVVEVVPQTVLETGSFYETICRYNNEMFSDRK